jgi:hypothetical protein
MRRLFIVFMMVGVLTMTSSSGRNTETITAFKCCKICKKGKACGDSCISKSYKCYKGKGCACDG